MTIGVEALAWVRHIRDWRDAWEVARRAAHPAVGLVPPNAAIRLATQERLSRHPAVPRK